MDEIATIYQSQFFLLAQLCFARYEIALLKGATRGDAYAEAEKTIEMYLVTLEQEETEAGKKLSDSTMRIFDLLVSNVQPSGQMN